MKTKIIKGVVILYLCIVFCSYIAVPPAVLAQNPQKEATSPVIQNTRLKEMTLSQVMTIQNQQAQLILQKDIGKILTLKHPLQ